MKPLVFDYCPICWAPTHQGGCEPLDEDEPIEDVAERLARGSG